MANPFYQRKSMFAAEIHCLTLQCLIILKQNSYSANDGTFRQGGITCGAIEDPRKSSKAIDERVIINFRDKNVVIARFRDKNVYR